MSTLTITADYTFYRTPDGTVYSSVPWNQSLAALFNEKFRKIVVVGNIVSIPGDRTLANLHEVDASSFQLVDLGGSETDSGSVLTKGAIQRAACVVQASDVLYLKMFYWRSLLFFFVNQYFRRPAATLLVGDVAEAALWTDRLPAVRLVRWVASRVLRSLTKLVQRNVERPGYVANYLRGKYGKAQEHSFIAAESWLGQEAFPVPDQPDKLLEIKSQVRALFVGRLVPLKGVRYLAEAVKELSSSSTGVQVEIDIVGSGPFSEWLMKYVNKHGLESIVTFHGHLKLGGCRLRKVYAANDIIILPSFTEGLPLSLLEGMAYGCIPVASNVGGVPEVVRDGFNGLLVEPGSSSAIASALSAIASNREEAKSMARNAYDTASNWTFRVERQRIADALKSLI